MMNILLDMAYHVRLEHDGETFSALSEAHERISVRALGCRSGGLELWRYTDRMVVLRRLSIEGVLDATRLGPRRET